MTDGGFDERLQDFGFSEKEAAVYRSLLQLGEAKPSEIASAANVSTRYVYAVGERLESRGFVTVNDHVTPTVMRALPPEEVIEGLRTELAHLESTLRQQYDAPEKHELRVEVMKTTMTLRKRIRTHIDRAMSSVVLSIPGVALTDIAAELRDARERGVLVLLVLGRSTAMPDVAGVADLVRLRPRSPTAMAAVDDSCGIVMSTDMLARSNSGDRAVLCSDPRVGHLLFGGFMGTIWLVAEEHYATEPAALPETYTSVRRAVIDAALHERSGTELHAHVTRNGPGSVSSGGLTGRIVDLRQPFIAPTSARFPTECTIVLDTGDDRVEIGGPGPIEERAEPTIRLEAA